MKCSYTGFKIDRRFGIPQNVAKGGLAGQLQLQGKYGSIGIMITAEMEKGDPNCISYSTLSILGRIGKLIGIDLNVHTEDKKTIYDADALKRLLALRAPSVKQYDSQGGSLTREGYISRDPTWKPDYDKFGQTAAEVDAQKTAQQEKVLENKKRKYGSDNEAARLFHFALPEGSAKRGEVTRITVADLKASGFLDDPKRLDVIEHEGLGLRISISGGSMHNKEATKRYYGKSGPSSGHNPLKGEVVIICTGHAPFDIQEYMELDPEWSENYKKAKQEVTPEKKTEKKVGVAPTEISASEPAPAPLAIGVKGKTEKKAK